MQFAADRGSLASKESRTNYLRISHALRRTRINLKNNPPTYNERDYTKSIIRIEPRWIAPLRRTDTLLRFFDSSAKKLLDPTRFHSSLISQRASTPLSLETFDNQSNRKEPSPGILRGMIIFHRAIIIIRVRYHGTCRRQNRDQQILMASYRSQQLFNLRTS